MYLRDAAVDSKKSDEYADKSVCRFFWKVMLTLRLSIGISVSNSLQNLRREIVCFVISSRLVQDLQ